MTLFNSLWQRLKIRQDQDRNTGPNPPLQISGVNPSQWAFFLNLFKKNDHPLFKRSHLLLCPSDSTAQQMFQTLQPNFGEDILYFPEISETPYGSVFPPESSLYRRFNTMSNIAANLDKRWVIIAPVNALLPKLPPPDFFVNNRFSVEISDIISPLEFKQKLVSIGYVSGSTVDGPGTFSSKGEIFDLYPISGPPMRIYYFDDMIEHIFQINPVDNTTMRESPVDKVSISPSPRILGHPKYVSIFKKHIPLPLTGHSTKYEYRRQIFELLNNGHLFENYPLFLPLFFEETVFLFDYLDHPVVSFLETEKCQQSVFELKEELQDGYKKQQDNINHKGIAPSPDELYLNELPKSFDTLNIEERGCYTDLTVLPKNAFDLYTETISSYLQKNMSATSGAVTVEFVKKIILFIKDEFCYTGKIIFVSSEVQIEKQFKNLLDLFGEEAVFKDRLFFESGPLEKGFFYPAEKSLVLTGKDLLLSSKRAAVSPSSVRFDLFAEQMATLKPGDFIIHSQYGLGKYLGLESLDFNGLIKTDFMTILYQNDDKVYVPVYRLDLVQKYADQDTPLKLESLRNKHFAGLTAKAKKSAKVLAFDLLKLQAERETSNRIPFSPPGDDDQAFERAFPFQTTPDQSQAIDSVFKDMQNARPMDRLVCGDVGLGKTEVAMRAAFKAIVDKKQVAVLVPTTILALQHYITFTERFKEFPVMIEFLSRFKTPKEVSRIKEQLANGRLDLIIGTHKLLSREIRFLDLGLVIVDEEQRFGVNHKEKLKLLKANVDFLTLSATPIPRTLHQTLLGLRDISLIQTPPPGRQAVKSYIVKEDLFILQSAIIKELNRGGQVFIVHNRVQSIEEYKGRIAELVPTAKILVAHGQLLERELERRIKDFYEGKHQILISTTIIENGIDMPNVNTLIVDRADMFGLSQLHQLRGRIGRSGRKAYAYFVIPENRMLSSISEKRLKALQTYTEIGSGFNIASCDLEIRGSGDILGAEQSGRMKEVGTELYMKLLKEAIGELQGEKKEHPNVEFNTPFPAFIPQHYIEDDSERLKYYKRISNTQDFSELEKISFQLNDIYGTLPQPVSTLFVILECRLLVKHMGLKQIGVTKNIITLRFDEDVLKQNTSLRDNIVNVFLEKIKSCQISPKFCVTYSAPEEVTPKTLLAFCREIGEKVTP